jgi:hypothetical protein
MTICHDFWERATVTRNRYGDVVAIDPSGEGLLAVIRFMLMAL